MILWLAIAAECLSHKEGWQYFLVYLTRNAIKSSSERVLNAAILVTAKYFNSVHFV